MKFDFTNVPAAAGPIVEAERRGHRFGEAPTVRGFDHDLRTTFTCTRCGDRVIVIAQRGRSVDVDGLATRLGRCPADIKRKT